MSVESKTGPSRRYRKRARAELEARTRERIAAAAVKLHGTVGPARTTVSAIAEEAGVQRATVYRHFPDDETLFDACTAQFYSRHPMPDVDAWAAIQDPDERLRRALADLYAWYEQTEFMLANTTRDSAFVPARARERFLAYFAGVHSALMSGRPERGRARVTTAAAIGHAIGFATWRSLAREQDLDRPEAADLMARMVLAAGR
jgi:AcrR family transcriptional regulator